MKKVTSWAAIIVPTLITGWYGMNVPYPGFARARRIHHGHHPDHLVLKVGSTCCSDARTGCAEMATIDDIRPLALSLPRGYEVLVRDRVKFRVGQYVWLAFSRDETMMGFVFPKEEREALVASEPHKFSMPTQSDMRYNWVVVRLDQIDADEAHEIVVDVWRMVVPKKVAREQLGD